MLELANISGTFVSHTEHTHVSLGKSKYNPTIYDPWTRNAKIWGQRPRNGGLVELARVMGSKGFRIGLGFEVILGHIYCAPFFIYHCNKL